MKITWLPHPYNTTHWLCGYYQNKLMATITGPNENDQMVLTPRELEVTGRITIYVDEQEEQAKAILKRIAEAIIEED